MHRPIWCSSSLATVSCVCIAVNSNHNHKINSKKKTKALLLHAIENAFSIAEEWKCHHTNDAMHSHFAHCSVSLTNNVLQANNVIHFPRCCRTGECEGESGLSPLTPRWRKANKMINLRRQIPHMDAIASSVFVCARMLVPHSSSANTNNNSGFRTMEEKKKKKNQTGKKGERAKSDDV